ncbi:MAG: hypothetical protein KGL39_39385 [Patescibacteria group bacterium]|nr:hypothetical protein [Patescibacteria group bacterium]
MTIITETTYKHEATGVEATPTTLDGKPVIAVNAGQACGDISLDEARALVEVLQAALGNEEDSDGWIPWSGGGCPVPYTEIRVKFRDGDTCAHNALQYLRWDHTGSDGDIIAYRIVKDSE